MLHWLPIRQRLHCMLLLLLLRVLLGRLLLWWRLCKTRP